jgi:hypothetical protein
MCKFFSAVITKKSVIWDIDNDSHEFLLEKAGIKDTKADPSFVRVELLPVDGNIFNHALKNWKLQVDQDYRPEWFDEADAERRVKKLITTVFKERFVINRTVNNITSGRWFVGTGGIVVEFHGGTLENFRGGTLQEFLGGTLREFHGGTLERFLGGTLQEFHGGTLQEFHGGTLQYFRGGTLQYFLGGTLQYFLGGTLQGFYGGTLQYFLGGTLQGFYGGTLQNFAKDGTGVMYNLAKNKIIVANPHITLEIYK